MKYILILYFFITAQSVFSFSAVEKEESKKNPILEKQFDEIVSKLEKSVYIQGGNIDLNSCLQLIKIGQKLNSSLMLATSYDLIGTYYLSSKGDNTTALEYFFKAVPLAEESENKRRISSIYFDIALAYFNMQDFEEAKKYIEKGGANLPDKTDPKYNYMLFQYQSNLAVYSIFSNQPEIAVKHAQEMVLTVRNIDSKLFQFNCFYINGAAYDIFGDSDLADVYFKKAEAISNDVHFNLTIFKFKKYYTNFLLKNKRTDEAKFQAESLYNLGLKTSNSNMKLVASGFLRQIYDHGDITEKAYFYAKQEIEINNEIFTQNNSNRLKALAFKEEIRTIEEDGRLEKIKEKEQRNIQFLFIAIGISLILTFFLILSRSVSISEKVISNLGIVTLLIVFEFINLIFHPFIEEITHHNPLLMLLILVGIAALLLPLHHKLEHWATNKLIIKNRAMRLKFAKKTIQDLAV